MTTAEPLRAQLQALLHFQTHIAAQGLPRDDAATAALHLEGFAVWCQQHPRGKPWGATGHAGWARAAQALLGNAAALPSVALQPGQHAGPLLHDVARLLRAKGVNDDEATELDEAIRWWDGARRAGLPVAADFGDCWRALEWLALQQHLLRLARGSAGEDAEEDAKEEAALISAVAKVALRYGPLKPLLRLLPAQPGAEVAAGYTF